MVTPIPRVPPPRRRPTADEERELKISALKRHYVDGHMTVAQLERGVGHLLKPSRPTRNRRRKQ